MTVKFTPIDSIQTYFVLDDHQIGWLPSGINSEIGPFKTGDKLSDYFSAMEYGSGDPNEEYTKIGDIDLTQEFTSEIMEIELIANS